MTDTEKAALERRIDELCAEVERLHANQAHWELGNCPSCPNVVSLQEALEQNAKLREYVTKLEQANIVLDSDNTDLLCDMKDMQFFIAENAKLREENQSIGMAAYEVGYRDGSIHYELEHCPACKNIADLQEALEENAKLQELFNETLIRLAAASEATGGRFIDAWYCELLESNGIEVY